MGDTVVQQWETADVQLVVRRVLPNPFGVPELRDLGGLDAAVQEYVRTRPEWPGLRDNALNQIRRRLDDGHQVVTVGVMCSGGHDRSVAAAELLARELRSWHSVDAFTRHLHLYRRHPWVPRAAQVGY